MSRSPAHDQLAARWDAVMMRNYGTPALSLVRGEGAHVWDSDGREYVDLYAGIAVSALGHAHPAVVEAVCRQVGTLGHVSNFVIHGPALELAERLLGLLGWSDGRVLFTNSGAEANETALKLARRYGRDGAADGTRTGYVATEGGFHGRTMGALSVTGQPGKRTAFEPLVPGVRFVPYGDSTALAGAVNDTVAAVILEPVQGERGVVPAPVGYLAATQRACAAAGALFLLDEVQGGIGRAGTWFSWRASEPEVEPDVVTLAKGLGGGLPLGACIARGVAATALRPGDHGTTFGGNPVSCAAALAVLDTIDSEDLLARAREIGRRLTAGLTANGHRLVAGVRGIGAWQAAVLTRPVAAAVEVEARRRGFLVNAVAPNAVRFAPPLVLSDADLDSFLRVWPEVLTGAGHTGDPR